MVKGNKFWELRAKHGRDKLFKSPSALMKAAEEYFTWCDENPWMKTEQLKKPTIIMDPDTLEQTLHATIQLPTQRPYTLAGLCLFLDVNSEYITRFEKGLKGKDDKISKDFSRVLTRIREIIYTQKFEGATVGAFNASIIAKDLGLRDKTDVKAEIFKVLQEGMRNGSLSEENIHQLGEIVVKHLKDAEE